MSVYGYLNCHTCKQTMWLGKALHEGHQPFAFHIGSGPKHWNRPGLNKLLWKFLADHAAHEIDVRLEHQMSDDMYAYREIGGDEIKDITENDYLRHPSGYYDMD